MAKKSNTDEQPGIGHNSEGVVGERLNSFLERIERLEEEKKGIADDIKDIYAEAKGVGFDVKIIRKVINRRKIEKEKLAEEDELLNLYEHAISNLNSMME